MALALGRAARGQVARLVLNRARRVQGDDSMKKLPPDAPVCPNCEGLGMIQVPERMKIGLMRAPGMPEYVTLNVLKHCPECSVR